MPRHIATQQESTDRDIDKNKVRAQRVAIPSAWEAGKDLEKGGDK